MSHPIAVSSFHHEQSEDLEALQLFQQLDAQIAPSSPPQHPSSHNNADLSEEEAPRFSRLSKMRQPPLEDSKKLSKKEKKRLKMKEKLKMKKKSKNRNNDGSATPRKKLKREGSTKKKSNNSEAEQEFQDDGGSSEFDSSSQDLSMQLKHLNPDNCSEESPKKRLKKSGRKEKIQNKEGFKLHELGNDPEVELSGHVSSDEEYSLEGKKKKDKKKRVKAVVLTNQEIMNAFKEHGVVESEGEDEGNRDYDRGIDMLNAMKKKSKDSIRINNRFFGDLEISLQNEEAQVAAVPEDFQLQLKPKNSSSSLSQRLSFLSKAENIKKMRGFDAAINAEDESRRVDQKAKKSMAKLISSMASQDYHEDIDLEIKVPTVSRGKSADIINNTFFLRKNMQKPEIEGELQVSPPELQTTKSLVSSTRRKEGISRQQLFKEIQEQTKLRRSKYISNQELKNSFKKTDLEELEQTRKRIQEKRRKEALSEDSENQELDSQMKEMIEKEEQICGDLNQDDQADDADYDPAAQVDPASAQQEPAAEERSVAEGAAAAQYGPQQKESNAGEGIAEQPQQVVHEQLEQYNEILEELQNHSSKLQEDQVHPQENEGNEDLSEEEQMKEEMEAEQQSQNSAMDNEESPEVEVGEEDIERKQQMQQLEEEGIILRKRRKNNQEKDQPEQVIEAINTDQEQEIRQQPQIGIQQPIIHEKSAALEEEYVGQQDEEFRNFKKLRKIAQVIARKKKEREMGKQYAAQFIEHEAEEGSDNQEHDDIVKQINYADEDKQYEGIDLDADLVELIDNAVDINEEDQFEAFRKYLEDVRMQDRDEIKKIIRGEFWKKHEDLELEMEEDQRKRQERMDQVMNWIKKRQQEEGQGIYLKEPSQKAHDSDDDSEADLKNRQQNQHSDEELESESEELPIQQQMARLTKFLEDNMPTTKKQYKPVGEIKLLPLPESVKRDNRNMGQKTISLSKLGSRGSIEVKPNKKSTSSIVNQILNKTMSSHTKRAPALFGKSGRK